MHRAPVLAVSFLLTLSLSGCRIEEAPRVAPTAAPHVGGAFRFALIEPTGLDPAASEDTYQTLLVEQIYEGLVDLDPSLNVVPSLARSWTIDGGGLRYHFALREGVRFHNGRPLTADDVAWSYARAARLPGGVAREYLGHIVGGRDVVEGRSQTFAGLKIESPSALTIELSEPYAPFLEALAIAQLRVIPREEVEKSEPHFAHHPVGTGPFRLKEWRPGERIVLEANAEHWKSRPLLDSIEIQVSPGRQDEALDAFRRGELDMAPLGREDRKALPLGTPIVERLQMSVATLGLNLAIPPLDDGRVRRAIALSLDRDAIVAASGRVAVPTRGIVPLGMAGGPPRTVAPSRNVAEARRILEDAGHRDGSGLAPVDLWTNTPSIPTHATLVTIAANMSEIGLRVRQHEVPWTSLIKSIDDGKVPAHVISWVADTPDRDSFLGVLFHSHGANNYLHFVDPEVDSLLIQARRELDPEVRGRLYGQVEDRVGASNVFIPLYNEASSFVVRRGLKGLAVDAMGYIDLATLHWERTD